MFFAIVELIRKSGHISLQKDKHKYSFKVYCFQLNVILYIHAMYLVLQGSIPYKAKHSRGKLMWLEKKWLFVGKACVLVLPIDMGIDSQGKFVVEWKNRENSEGFPHWNFCQIRYLPNSTGSKHPNIHTTQNILIVGSYGFVMMGFNHHQFGMMGRYKGDPQTPRYYWHVQHVNKVNCTFHGTCTNHSSFFIELNISVCW